MGKYDTYFLMKTNDVPGYVQEKYSGYFEKDAVLSCQEIGDGNINYVYRVKDEASGKSMIVKQAGVETRISKDLKASTDRNRIESEILQIQHRYAPGFVPVIFGYDTVMHACCMEDLAGYELMRYALMRHETFPRFADDISTFMVNTLLMTTDIVMNHKEKKELVKRFINPDLCEITEDLVLTEPYNDNKHRNIVFPPNWEFVQKELYGDAKICQAAAALKFRFMNKAEALLHGDLHTGSIFVKKDSTKIFDPEFAFFGPMGYDVGNVVANLIFAYDNGMAYGDDAFASWALDTVRDTVDLFIEKFRACYDRNATDSMAKVPGFREMYLADVLADTAAYAGTELHRRTVGMAQVKDVTSITDLKARMHAERVNVFCGKDYILHERSFGCGQDFVDAVLRAENEAKKTEG